MTFRVGDAIFTRDARVNSLEAYDPNQNRMELSTHRDIGVKEHRHGYHKGMTPGHRQEFNRILDEVKKSGSPKEIVNKLNQQIEGMEISTENVDLIGYLKNQLNHLKVQYGVDSDNLSINMTSL